jgi:hypothetical protein
MAVEILKDADYSAEDVLRFSLALARHQYEERFSYRAGLFLTALTGKGKMKDFTLDLRHIGPPIAFFGLYMNHNNILIHGGTHHCLGYATRGIGMIHVVGGGTGEEVGTFIQSGTIIIDGDCGDVVGSYLDGGLILVNGNVGDKLGYTMGKAFTDVDSRIIVNGNAGRLVGQDMGGGEIHINGDFESIGNVHRGRIFHKNRLIVDR